MKMSFIGCIVLFYIFSMLPIVIYFGLFSYLIYRLNYKWLKWFVISFLVYSAMLAILSFTEFIMTIEEEFDDEE